MVNSLPCSGWAIDSSGASTMINVQRKAKKFDIMFESMVGIMLEHNPRKKHKKKRRLFSLRFVRELPDYVMVCL
jgi:hypothetical protein